MCSGGILKCAAKLELKSTSIEETWSIQALDFTQRHLGMRMGVRLFILSPTVSGGPTLPKLPFPKSQGAPSCLSAILNASGRDAVRIPFPAHQTPQVTQHRAYWGSTEVCGMPYCVITQGFNTFPIWWKVLREPLSFASWSQKAEASHTKVYHKHSKWTISECNFDQERWRGSYEPRIRDLH